MKIAIIIDHIYNDVAGTEGQVVKLVCGLAEHHDIDLIFLRETPWSRDCAVKLPARVSTFALSSVVRPQFWLQLWRLWRHLRQSRPDVVHTFFPIANIVGVLCARWAGVRAIVSSRRDYGHWITPGYLKATRFANRFADAIITNSAQVKALTERVEGFDGRRIEVIPNGVDVDRFAVPRNEALKASLGIAPDRKVITLVANYRPIKRHDLLLDATAKLVQERPDVCLLFVGADNAAEPARDATLAHAKALGLQDRVYRAHAQGDVEQYLSFCDVGVNCSDSEGLSNAVIEYMCARVPVVVSEGGGNVDLVQNGVNGLSFAVGDAQGFYEQLRRLLEDAALRERCVASAYEMVHSQMSLKAVLARFESTYLDLIGKGRGKRGGRRDRR